MLSEKTVADLFNVSLRCVTGWRLRGLIKPAPGGGYTLQSLASLPGRKGKLVQQMLAPTPVAPAAHRPYRCIELFAGGGGLALGLERAGFQSQALYEKDSHACATLRVNRPHWNVIEGDVSQVDFSEYLGIDLLSAGFPCQPFSVAGVARGLEDTRGTLFYQVARAVKESRPKVFLCENVRGLVHHDKGRTLRSIQAVFQALGYTLLEPTVLKAMLYRVPQKRERLFLVGIRNDLFGAFQWPLPHHRVYTLRDALKAGELYPTDCPSSPGQRYSAKRAAVLAQVPPGGCWRDLPPEVGLAYLGGAAETGGGQSSTARRLSWDEVSLTLLTHPSQKQTERCHPDETRPLTVREYARIQTFPDDWVFSGSLASQYRQIGNAVPTHLAEAVGNSLVALFNQWQT